MEAENHLAPLADATASLMVAAIDFSNALKRGSEHDRRAMADRLTTEAMLYAAVVTADPADDIESTTND